MGRVKKGAVYFTDDKDNIIRMLIELLLDFKSFFVIISN